MVFKDHRLCISSISLGWHESHTLTEKLLSASRNGYRGVEIVYSDLQKEATARNESLENCAAHVATLCRQQKLGVAALAAFENYEGSPLPLSQRLASALSWVNIARILGADFVQVPASYEVASLAVSEDEIVHELRLLADCGLPRPGTDDATILIAYEPMSWSVRTSTWEHALYIKRRVARTNFKLCLDTYHILTKLWGECTSVSGRIPGGDAALKASLNGMLHELHPDDIAFIQLSDVERMDPPVSFAALREVGKHQAWYWCSWGRLFPLETEYGAYLPMVDICRVWLTELGWSGWVSMETFHRHMAEEDRRPEHWARRGIESWTRLQFEVDKDIAKREGPRSKL